MLARRCKKLTALFLTLCMVTGMLGTGALAAVPVVEEVPATHTAACTDG